MKLSRSLAPLSLIAAIAALGSGCATYNHAEQVKMVSFTDDLKKGVSVGNVRGEDCTWSVLGYKMGGPPTLDKAFLNSRNQVASGGLLSDTVGKQNRGESLRYVNNVHTANEGFDAYVVGKQCIVVSGLGFK